MPLILGLDGGGTKTHAMIMETETGKVVYSKAGSSNYKSVGLKIAEKNINKSVLDLIDLFKKNSIQAIYFNSSCFGLSGCDSNIDYEIYKKIIFNSKISPYLNPEKTIICNDTKIGLHSGTDNKNSIILICGTGSNCYGFNEFGEESIVNGWDYILGDEGSGYEIGLKALRALMRYYDGRGRYTLLYKTILEELKFKYVYELVHWIYSPFSKEKIANLARTVEKTAYMGDKISIKIISLEALEAVRSVRAVVSKLKIEEKIFDCILAGGIFKDEKYFKSIVISNLQTLYKKINIKHLEKKPVEGAIKLALQVIMKGSEKH